MFSPLCLWQSFSNADLVDEEPLLVERSCSTPQWRCYAKYISSQQILLTFLPASFKGTPWLNWLDVGLVFSNALSKCKLKCVYFHFADVLMLMASGLETDPRSNVSVQEDDTLTPSNKSQADSLSGSTSGLERSESGLSLASKLRRSSSSGHFTVRSPVLSPQSEGQTGPVDSLTLDQDSWDSRVSETETWTPSSGWSSCKQNWVLVVQVKLSLGQKLKHATHLFTSAAWPTCILYTTGYTEWFVEKNLIFWLFRCGRQRRSSILWTTKVRFLHQLQQAGFSAEYQWRQPIKVSSLCLQLLPRAPEGAAGAPQLQPPAQGHLFQVLCSPAGTQTKQGSNIHKIKMVPMRKVFTHSSDRDKKFQI